MLPRASLPAIRPAFPCEVPMLSGPMLTRPRKSGILNVVDPSPVPIGRADYGKQISISRAGNGASIAEQPFPAGIGKIIRSSPVHG